MVVWVMEKLSKGAVALIVLLVSLFLQKRWVNVEAVVWMACGRVEETRTTERTDCQCQAET